MLSVKSGCLMGDNIIGIQYKEGILNKNIGIFLNYALGSPPLELHISNTIDLLNRGNKVTIYVCDGELKSCTANPLHSKSVCRYCKFRSLDALKDIKNDIEIKFLDLSLFDNNVDDAKITEPLELGVMSSMASLVKAQSYDQLNHDWKKYHDNMLNSAGKLYNYFVNEIQKNCYDYMFMFNGRFGDVKPVLEATRKSNIGYGLIEVKKSLHEIVFINELIHSIDGNTRRALRSYIENQKDASNIAKVFYGKKVKNENTGDPVYTQNQQSGLLPNATINTDKKIVVIYPTTDDEYKFIGSEWDGYVPEDQVDEIQELALALKDKDYLLVVKMHPNQANTAENVLERYLDLEKKYNNVVVEPPLSKKDTYALMHKADFVINFASTIGVEACYARKIVILIGDTTFSRMNIAYKAKSGGEAAKLILSGALKPKPIKGAIIWGNYLASYADNLPSFSRVSNGDYTVNGKKIGRSRLLRALQLPAKLRLEMKKPGFKFNFAFILKGKDILINTIKGKWTVK